MKPAIAFSSVDFPQPDGPITATNSPPATATPMPRRARTEAPAAPNVFRSAAILSTSFTSAHYAPRTRRGQDGHLGAPLGGYPPLRSARCPRWRGAATGLRSSP